MRISTSTIYEQSGTQISNLQSSVNTMQQKIASGKSFLTPSENAIAAAQVLTVTQSQSINAQFATNRMYAKDSLVSVDSTLSSVTDMLQNLKTTVLSAGNPSLSDANRAAMATTIRAQLSSMVGLANATDGNGKYLFAGYHTTTAPFVEQPPGTVTYVGDQGQRQLQVDNTRQIGISESGQAIFQTSAQDIFKTLNDFANLLDNPSAVTTITPPNTVSDLTVGVQTANTNIAATLDNVLTARASTGSKLNELDSLDTYGSDRDVQYTQTLSALQDLDYAKAVTSLTQQQTTLQAAQQSFVKLANLSLFNYIN
ncbi:MAG: flagellar hook-associated protein FlgL [Sulfuriferula sp.]